MPQFSRLDYERLLYTLPQVYPEVESSSLHFFTTSRSGSMWFHNGLELRVQELVDFSDGEILDYSYNVFSDPQSPDANCRLHYAWRVFVTPKNWRVTAE